MARLGNARLREGLGVGLGIAVGIVGDVVVVVLWLGGVGVLVVLPKAGGEVDEDVCLRTRGARVRGGVMYGRCTTIWT